MDVRDWLRRLGLGSPKPQAGRTPPPQATTAVPERPAVETALEVTAHLLWGQKWDQDPSWHFGRALYTTRPNYRHDLTFLGRLLCRVNELWNRGQPRTDAEATALQHIQSKVYVPDQRVQLPPDFCKSDSVYLHDLDWRQEEVGPDLEPGEFNRSLRRLRLSSGRAVFQPASPGEVTRRVRERLRALRARGAFPVRAVRVQANYTLYEPGDNDAPGVVLFSPSADFPAEELTNLADELFAARNGQIETPAGWDDAVDLLRANVHHWMYHRRACLTTVRALGHDLYVADLWFHRPFLRDHQIVREQGRELRCLIELGDAGGIELLPWDSEIGPAVKVNSEWLRWNDGCVVKLAQNIGERRTFDQLPILADALEEAGCTSPAILNHCRRADPHPGRCWVIDLVLESGDDLPERSLTP